MKKPRFKNPCCLSIFLHPCPLFATSPAHFSFLQLRAFKCLAQVCTISVLSTSLLGIRSKLAHWKCRHKEDLVFFTTITTCENCFSQWLEQFHVISVTDVETELQGRQVTCPSMVKLPSNPDGLTLGLVQSGGQSNPQIIGGLEMW